MATRVIPLSEVAKHNTKEDCWVVIHGNVYDLTTFLPDHPAGTKVILNWAGKDATGEFGPSEASTEEKVSLPAPVVAPSIVEENAWVKPPLAAMLNLFDLEYVASRVMSAEGWGYYSSGADDEITLRENHAAFQRIFFKPRILVDVKSICTKSKILGYDTSFPVYISAAALGKLAHPDGEVAFTRAAYNEGIIQMCPTLASCTLEEMTDARSPGQIQFYQLYVNSDRKITAEIVKKAERLGCKALCVTVDAPALGKREKDMRNKFSAAPPDVQSEQDINRSQGTARAISTFIDPSLSWKDVAWLKSITSLPLVLKGVQCAEDAILAAEQEVDAIILSNHGGRQLDFARSAIEILPEVMNALRAKGYDKKMEVWIDGGIRRGTDVLKALALGATAVGIGRPALYGLAAYGQEGVEKALQILKVELDMAMRLIGAPTVADIHPGMVIARNLDNHVSITKDYLGTGSYIPLTFAAQAKL